MRTMNWILTAALLVSVSAAAQQAADSQASAQPAVPDAAQTAQPSQPAAPTPEQQSTPAASQPGASSTQPSAQTMAPPATVPAPTTMDQVVNLFIERERGLIKALANRTPVVETYLQNLTADPQLGPIPSEDHYFLGRLDMGETVDRKDYLKEEQKVGMQARLLGGFSKLYKVQYQPMGFSWMV